MSSEPKRSFFFLALGSYFLTAFLGSPASRAAAQGQASKEETPAPTVANEPSQASQETVLEQETEQETEQEKPTPTAGSPPLAPAAQGLPAVCSQGGAASVKSLLAGAQDQPAAAFKGTLSLKFSLYTQPRLETLQSSLEACREALEGIERSEAGDEGEVGSEGERASRAESSGSAGPAPSETIGLIRSEVEKSLRIFRRQRSKRAAADSFFESLQGRPWPMVREAWPAEDLCPVCQARWQALEGFRQILLSSRARMKAPGKVQLRDARSLGAHIRELCHGGRALRGFSLDGMDRLFGYYSLTATRRSADQLQEISSALSVDPLCVDQPSAGMLP